MPLCCATFKVLQYFLSTFSFKPRPFHHMYGLGMHLTSKANCLDGCYLCQGPNHQMCGSHPVTLPQPGPLQPWKHGTSSKLSSTAAWVCNQGNFPLFNRKRNHNHYIQNHNVFLVFSHPWELSILWSKDHITKSPYLNIPSRFSAKQRTLWWGKFKPRIIVLVFKREVMESKSGSHVFIFHLQRVFIRFYSTALRTLWKKWGICQHSGIT